jgi:hypothetical protein
MGAHTAGQDCRDIPPDLLDLGKRFGPVHDWHRQVEDYSSDRRMTFPKDFYATQPILGQQDGVSVSL